MIKKEQGRERQRRRVGVENKELGCGTVLTSAPQELHAELPGP